MVAAVGRRRRRWVVHLAVSNNQALTALRRLSELREIIPAPQTAHAALRAGGLVCLRWQLTM
jgi:tryptophan synthase beta subunit